MMQHDETFRINDQCRKNPCTFALDIATGTQIKLKLCALFSPITYLQLAPIASISQRAVNSSSGGKCAILCSTYKA